MNSTAHSTVATTSTSANNFGFKSQIQFRVAQRLAGQFYHAWGTVSREVEVRKYQPCGADKIEMKTVIPATPKEAYEWVQEDNQKYRPIGQCYGIPTPEWESTSRTYGVVVNPDGSYIMTYNGLLWAEYTPEGERTDAGLVPHWWEWHLDPKGQGGTLQQSMRYACAEGIGGGGQRPEFIRLFEADSNFWKSGLVAGTRWYEWWAGAGPDMAE